MERAGIVCASGHHKRACCMREKGSAQRHRARTCISNLTAHCSYERPHSSAERPSAAQAYPDIWTQKDMKAMAKWVLAYIDFLEREPVAVYARMMANYVGANFDEQLLACYTFVGKCGLCFTPASI